ncbi:MAG: DegV family EDD domain-containing protein [Clostridia bacterium]|nr:DegV family EDD domain-containing protein [Clostridia bacterium]MBQ4602043.1 DegV family EDD domain-containing protein [Clostridia bacterium]
MNKYIILADVTCDLSAEIREYFGIEDYIKGHVHFSDTRDFNTTLDWSEVGREEFYKALSSKKSDISTAPASPEEYYLIFKGYAEKGYDILSMSISSKISSTYNVAVGAAKRVGEEFPDRKIYCFDSYKMSGAFGLLVMYAHMLKNEGSSFDEVVARLEENKHRVHQMGPIDDLIFVARRGRITMGKAIMGSFAGVKPMGDCNRDGYVSVLTKVKGINKALDMTVRYAEQAAVNVADQYLLISHSNRPEYAEKLKALIEERLNPKKVFVSDVFSGCGTNIGPGMVAVYFFGEELSEDLAAEKEIMTKLLNG